MPEVQQKKSVLVIDDEPLVRDTLVMILAASGYDVQVLGSAKASIELISDSGYAPDVVIIDYCMPDMDGVTAIRELRKLSSNTRYILCTGSDELIFDSKKSSDWRLIRKPFMINDLIKAVSQSIGE